MSLQIGDNFLYRGRKPLDNRIVASTIPDLIGIAESTIYSGIIAYVVSEKKYYTYDESNSLDPQLQKWRELTTAGVTIQSTSIDTVTTSATYGHLFLHLSDGTNLDCGNVIGPQGPQGEGFAIAAEYTSIQDMLSATPPVADGKMVAVIVEDISGTTLHADVYLRNSNQAGGTGKNQPGYTWFCDLVDAATIVGPQGPQGPAGPKGDTPVVTLTPVQATTTTPAGTKVTITTGSDPATQTSVDFTIYNGKDGVGISNVQINAQGHLIITMTDTNTYDLGVIGSGQGGGCITILGCFDTPPTTFVQNDMYYNKTDGKIYKATSNTTWDTGSTPQTDMLYISIDDKTIYAYTNNTWTIYGGTGVSQEPNNAIQQKTDGLYVKNIEPLINQMKAYARIADARVPEYFFAYGHQGNGGPEEVSFRYPGEFNFLPHWDSTETNMDASRYNMTDGYVILKAGITYKLVASILHSDGQGSYWIEDVDTREILATRGFGGPTNALVGYSNVDSCGIITPTEDIKVSVFHGAVSGAQAAGSLYYPSCSYFLIQEMNTLTVDPLEHIDLTQGIEDVPVGHTIVCTATSAPKHYLPCDGKEYKIADYPDLAAHFLKEFGIVNIFGGDGIETFAVPTSPIESYQSIMQPISASQGDDYYCVSAGEYGPDPGHHDYYAFDGANNTFYLSGDAGNPYLGIVFDQPKAVCKYTLLSRNKDANDTAVFPKDFVFQGTNDGSIWEDIDTQTGITCTTRNQLFEFTLSKPVAYKGYRIYCTANNGYREPIIGVAEFGLYMYTQIECIKYEPTYFIGTINGRETVEDIATPLTLTGTDITNGAHTFTDKLIILFNTVKGYDEIELRVQCSQQGVSTYNTTETVRLRDIEYVTSSDTEYNKSYIAKFLTFTYNGEDVFGFTVYFRFIDENTISITHFMNSQVTADEITIQVRGIKNHYEIQ